MGHVAIGLAMIHQETILFTLLHGKENILLAQKLIVTTDDETSSPEVHSRCLRMFSDRVTSLAICSLKHALFAIVAEWAGNAIKLTFQPLDDDASHRHIIVPVTIGGTSNTLEEFVSIAVSAYSTGNLVLVCGTRNGIVVLLEIDENTLEIRHSACDRVGATPAIVRRDEHAGIKEVFFVNSDSKLFAFTTIEVKKGDSGFDSPKRQRTINQIWLTDVTNPNRQQPKINSVARLPIDVSARLYDGILTC